MKVLHIIDTTGPGGAETVFVQLADLIRGQGLESTVVIHGEGWICDELRRRGLEPVIIPASGSFAVKFLYKLVGLIIEKKIDVIQSHLLGSNVYSAIAGLLTRTPVVATYHGMVDVNPNERFRAIKYAAMKWGISTYVAVSRGLMNDILQRGLLDATKTEIIYNGIEVDRYTQPPQHRLRSELGIDDDAILIGSLGNIRTAKAYDVLIEVAGRLAGQNPKLHFVIAGHKKASLMEPLTQLIERLGLQDRVHFIGFRQDCADFLAEVNIFLLSSSSEGFSISTIEAMCAGLPVVVTRCGGPQEIVDHEDTGLMADVGDVEGIAAAIQTLIDDPAAAAGLARRGKAHAVSRFGVDNMLTAYSDIYRRLVPGR